MRRSVLPGGLRVVTEFMPAVRSVALGIWVGVGSRDEDPPHAGATHYLEHLLFKGTRKRTALDISAAMDAVGGELNAFTGKEYTCYYARVLDADLPLAIDVAVGHGDRRRCIESQRRRRRAGRDPRRDRHERRRPGRRGARRVRRAPVRRHAARPPGPRHGRVDQRDHPGADLRALPRRYTPPHLVVAAAGNLDHDAVVAPGPGGVRVRLEDFGAAAARRAAAARFRRALGRLRAGRRVPA